MAAPRLYIRWSAALLLLLSLCGCTAPPPPPTPPPTRPAASPTAVPRPSSTPTATPTPIPTGTPTSTPRPSPTPNPNWTSYTNANGVHDIAFDGDRYLWVASGGGVVRWDLQDMNHTKYTTQDGLAHNDVACLAVGLGGVVWAGTSYGVSRFDGQHWTTYTTADGLPGDVFTAVGAAPDGIVWVGTGHYTSFWPAEFEGRGVARFDGQRWTTYTTQDGLASDLVNTIAVAPDGMVWFGTDAGASRFDGQAWTTFTTADGLIDNQVLAITVAPDGAVWFGTATGVSRYLPRP